MNLHEWKMHLLKAQFVVVIMLLGGIGIAALVLAARGGTALPASHAWAAPEWVRQSNEMPPQRVDLQDAGDAYLEMESLGYTVLPGSDSVLEVKFVPAQFDDNIVTDITFTLDYDPDNTGWLLFDLSDADTNGIPDGVISTEESTTQEFSKTGEGEIQVHLTYDDSVKEFDSRVKTTILQIELEATRSVEDMPPESAEANVLLKAVAFSNSGVVIDNDNLENSSHNDYTVLIQSSLSMKADPKSIKLGQTTNLTAEFTARDYARLKWDFDGDGTWDTVTTKAEAEIKDEDGENIGAGVQTPAYYAEGTYAPRVTLCYDNTDDSCILEGEASGLNVNQPSLLLQSKGTTYLGTPAELTAVLDPDFTAIAEEIAWEFGDGTALGRMPYMAENTVREHEYKAPETYSARVTVYLPDNYTPSSVEKTVEVEVEPPGLTLKTDKPFYYRSQQTIFTVSIENLYIDGSTIEVSYGDGNRSTSQSLNKDDGEEQNFEFTHTYANVNADGYPAQVKLSIPQEYGGSAVTAEKSVPVLKPVSDVSWLNDNPFRVQFGTTVDLVLSVNDMVDEEKVPRAGENVDFTIEEGSELGRITGTSNGGKTDENGVITATLETEEEFGTIVLFATVTGRASEDLNVQMVKPLYTPLVLKSTDTLSGTGIISPTDPLTLTIGF